MSDASLASSAYVGSPRVPVSPHYTGVRLFGAPLVFGPFTDPLGFSRQRWLAGEADVDAGRVLSLDEAMNVLRAQVHGDGA